MADQMEFTSWDYVVFALMLVVSAGIGFFFAFTGGKQRTTKEFLMADRSMSLLPIAISILVSFISAILILGTPAEMYTAGTEWWLLAGGMSMANLMAALIFVPMIHPLQLTSSYEYLERRFQHKAPKIVGTVIMLIQQSLYIGIASFAPSTALEAVTGFPDWATILIVGAVSTFYTTLGGMKAVVWTDVFQAAIMLVGLLAVIIQGAISVGGIGEVWKLSGDWGRLKFPSFDPDPTRRHSFWNLFIGGTVGSMSTFAISQASVQRYSTLPNVRVAQLSLAMNCIGVVVMVSLTCLAGLIIFAYYAQQMCDPLSDGLIANYNQIAPHFVMEVLGYPGLPGLFVACLFSGALSSTSSSLNAAATVTWKDFLEPYFGGLPMSRQTLITKLLVVIFGCFGIAMSFMARSLGGTVIQASSSFTGSASGPLLGLFLLGGLFPWANWKGAVTGGIIGLAFPMWISIGSYTLDVESHNLPMPTDNCTSFNATSTVAPVVEPITGINRLYTLSYMWFSSTGVLTCVVIGLIVSFATGPMKADEVESKYLIPIFDQLFCCFPDKWRRLCRCGKYSNDEVAVFELEHDKTKSVSTKPSRVAPLEAQNGDLKAEMSTTTTTKRRVAFGDQESSKGDNLDVNGFGFDSHTQEQGDPLDTIDITKSDVPVVANV